MSRYVELDISIKDPDRPNVFILFAYIIISGGPERNFYMYISQL